MTIFTRSSESPAGSSADPWRFFSGLGGQHSSRTPAFIVLWALVGLVAVINFVDVLVRWAVITDSSFAAFGLYPVGGRVVQGLVFLGLFFWLAAKSRAWLLGLSSVYFLARFLRLEEFVIDALGSKDTLQSSSVEALETWGLLLTVINALVVVFLLGLLVATLLASALYRAYRDRFADDFKALRISEVFLWAINLAQVVLLILMWFLLWLGGDAFSVLATYPVIGRLVLWIVFLVLLLVAIRSRALIIGLALVSYLVTLLNIDGVLVETFDQVDRFSGSLANTSSLRPLDGVIGLLQVLLPVVLIWVVVLAIARVVRARARNRIETWVDARRTAIYGVEDHGGDQPTRVSVLAVLALVFAIWFPVLGLVLAYAARNDFVSAKPRKSGVDLAVAATIIGWFGLGAQLFLAIFWIFVSAVLGLDFLDFVGELFATFLGLN